VGPVRREHTCGGIRTPAAITRRGRVRPRQVRRSRLAGRPGLGPRGCGAAGPAGRHAGPARAARRWKAEIAAAGDARSGRARAEQAESQLQRARADHDQAAGQAAPAAGPGPARHRQHSPGNLATSNHSCRTSRSARVPGRAQLAPNSSISADLARWPGRAAVAERDRTQDRRVPAESAFSQSCGPEKVAERRTPCYSSWPSAPRSGTTGKSARRSRAPSSRTITALATFPGHRP
jgi:hypothetical protein